MKIEKIKQVTDGMKVSVTFPNRVTYDAVVHVPAIDPRTGDRRIIRSIWVCYDTQEEIHRGSSSPDMKRMNASWYLEARDNGAIKYLGGSPQILSAHDAQRKLLHERVQLIRCMEEVVPKAKEIGRVLVYKKIIRLVRKDADGHFLSYSQDHNDKVSYAGAPDLKFNNRERTYTSLGRYIRRRLGVSRVAMADEALQILTQAVFAHLDVRCYGDLDKRFQILDGPRIKKAYEDSVGMGTCMTGEGRGYQIDFYVENPEVCKLLVYTRLDGVQSRAILWKTEDGTRLVDRIYPNAGPGVDDILMWAKRKGYRVRKGQGAMCTDSEGVLSFDPPGEVFQVTMKMAQNKCIPYLDTLRWGLGVGDHMLLTNRGPRAGEQEFRFKGKQIIHKPHCNFDNTDGYYYSTCELCGKRMKIPQGMMFTEGGECLCPSCHRTENVKCDCCGRKIGTGGSQEIGDTGKRICQKCADTDAYKKCLRCGRYFSTRVTNLVETLYGSRDSICNECVAVLRLKTCSVCKNIFVTGASGICSACEHTHAVEAARVTRTADAPSRFEVPAGWRF